MRILIVTPHSPAALDGNRNTALRWAGILRDLGHEVRVGTEQGGEEADLLVALHATKTLAAQRAWRERCAEAPLVLVLTGTDVFGEPLDGEPMQEALSAATEVICLNPAALEALPAEHRGKARVILQSASAPSGALPPAGPFDVCVIAHLREVKDPLLAARAARLLPADSRIRVRLVGCALRADWSARADHEARTNPRFEWLGERPQDETRRLLAASKLLVVTSRNEGGPAVVGEAVMAGVPILSTRMPAAVGLLGADYPGLYAVGDAAGLARLMTRAETDPAFLAELHARSQVLRPELATERERERIATLLSPLEAALGEPAGE